MHHNMVSVIIPVYNCESFLEICINSILRQTYPNIEIILVNDGSIDSSPRICDRYAKQFANVKVVHQENQGPAAARKNGIEHSHGQYIMFVDADDWLEDDFIGSLLSLALKHNTDAVIGNLYYHSHRGVMAVYEKLESGYYSRQRLSDSVFPALLSASPFFSFGILPAMVCKLFRRHIVVANAFALDTGIRYGEDTCFTLSALLDCQSIYISDVLGYNYRQNPNSITQSFHAKTLTESVHLKEFLQKLSDLKSWNAGTQIDEYMAYICLNVVRDAVKSPFMRTPKAKQILVSYIDQTLPKDFLKNNLRSLSFKTRLKLFLIEHRAISLFAFISRLKHL